MKTIKAILLAAVITMSFSAFAQKSVKIGHINSNELLSAMPERETIQKDIEDYAAQLTTTMDAMRKEYESKVADFQSKQEVMSDIIRENKIKEITDLEKRITEFQKTAQADLQKKEEKLLQPIIDKAKQAIDDVAKENNYTYVLDSSMGVVLYSIESDDILPLVKKKLGIN
ncbi:MAG: OmpH family outer membrane protein [Flavobacteriales bacterium]|jgi:outer membrane protein|nr:OmpH family outer membrane protein [Flavobacteriales bacterium]MCW8912475.1 OmpH family outer membrane protein [Flavobacteriales bacterium]MCW8936559.1 OmpH family outer membrane protein [Flavobacteriales bacterium]MCW8940952.1 OmpH family outer membrane protein [Flavobacteriales bacterium]MCW8968006.1 OmpH family outer membrane protein [Flavobacteriales bacterium]